MHKTYRTDILVVGSGAGSVGVVSELALTKKNVMIAELGKRDAVFGEGIPQRGKRIYLEEGVLPMSAEGVGYHRHLGFGGTVEISCANGVRPSEEDQARLGIDIASELDQVETELGVQATPDDFLSENTKQLINAAGNCGYEMNPMPKFIDFNKCRECGMCEMICSHDAVWSTRRKLEELLEYENLSLLDGVKIERVEMNGTTAVAAWGSAADQQVRIEANQIVLAAGALATPVILQNSGFEAGSDLFLDLFLVIYGLSTTFDEYRGVPMGAVYGSPDGSFVLAPYMDIDLWHGLTGNKISKWFKGQHMTGLMLKIADESGGRVTNDGAVHKGVTDQDQKIFDRGIDVARKILLEAGAGKETITVTQTARGAHPGGTTSIGKVVDADLLVKGTRNLFVADAGVLPAAPGKPPILAIMALARRLGKAIS